LAAARFRGALFKAAFFGAADFAVRAVRAGVFAPRLTRVFRLRLTRDFAAMIPHPSGTQHDMPEAAESRYGGFKTG